MARSRGPSWVCSVQHTICRRTNGSCSVGSGAPGDDDVLRVLYNCDLPQAISLLCSEKLLEPAPCAEFEELLPVVIERVSS
jgi:hypothetical protein